MRKSNKVIGTTSYINRETGEIKEMPVVETDIYEKDSNFHKLFLQEFISALELVANQKTKLCYWIITNMNRDNMLLYSYRQIADKTGISYGTVADTMKTLLEKDFLRRHSSGYYIINPGILFKGTYQRRSIALGKYYECEKGESLHSEEKRLQDIQKTIAKLQRQEKRIQKGLDMAKAFEESDTKKMNTPE